MKSRIQLLLSIMLFAFVICINTTQAKEIDALSFVLTNEGDDKMIERLDSAGCKNLYDALVYLRKNMQNDAPTVLTSNMDALLDSLKKLSGNGEVFTASLMEFADEAANPVGINSDGTFILAPLNLSAFDGHEGYARYSGSELFTYATTTEHNIYLGSTETDEAIINYYAFAVAWNGETDGVTDEGSRREALAISPNPASEYIEIAEPSEGLRVRIYNSLGECVINYESGITNYELGIRIDVSNLPVGAYYLRMSNMTCKFVIAR